MYPHKYRFVATFTLSQRTFHPHTNSRTIAKYRIARPLFIFFSSNRKFQLKGTCISYLSSEKLYRCAYRNNCETYLRAVTKVEYILFIGTLNYPFRANFYKTCRQFRTGDFLDFSNFSGLENNFSCIFVNVKYFFTIDLNFILLSIKEIKIKEKGNLSRSMRYILAVLKLIYIHNS